MATSLLLDVEAWDLALDAAGNWALAEEPYAILQNVACACRLFRGELFYDITKGVPYYQSVFASAYPLPLLKQDLVDAAEAVDGVNSAALYVQSLVNRKLTGQIQVSTQYGTLYASV